jgi:hypothetical protein
MAYDPTIGYNRYSAPDFSSWQKAPTQAQQLANYRSQVASSNALIGSLASRGAVAPGYTPTAGTTSGTTGAMPGTLPQYLLDQTATSLSGALRGELPEDVTNLLQQQAAEYGVAAGIPGSQFAGYRGLRNLGLTSLSRISEAEKLLTPQFTTPAQAEQLSQGRAKIGLEEQSMMLQDALQQQKLAMAAAESPGNVGTRYLAPGVGSARGGNPVTGTGGYGAPSAAQTAGSIVNRYLGGGGGNAGMLPETQTEPIARQFDASNETVLGRDFTTPGVEAYPDLMDYYGYQPEDLLYMGGIYGYNPTD